MDLIWMQEDREILQNEMIYYGTGSENCVLRSDDLKKGIFSALQKIGKRKKVIVIPPDFTRFHSAAGELTTYIYQYYKDSLRDILPALGTHAPMTDKEIGTMYSGIPKELFRVHDWKNDVITSGVVSGEYISQITSGKVDYQWPAQLNRLIFEGDHDLILSAGQVVPHEVLGMAGYNKNIFIGTGGSEGISKSHFIGAVYGMEKIMGKTDNPVRQLLNFASEKFIKHLPLVYIHTVIGRDDSGKPVVRGLYIGDDQSVFQLAAELSLKVNLTITEKPLKKVVVYLDKDVYKSTWLGNKAIYRIRMAMADNGELIVLAPGIGSFGEEREIDRIIRKYGYCGTTAILNYAAEYEDLQKNLCAAAHLIHGSSEERFSITYCPGYLTRKEIESVNFKFADLHDTIKKYKPEKLIDGFNKMPDGEEIFFISNPGLGLWASKERLKQKHLTV